MKQVELDDPALLRRVRLISLIMATSALLWVPCAACSLVFFSNDHLYRLTLFDPFDETALVDIYRQYADELKGKEGFYCFTRRSPGYNQPDERDVVVRVMDEADSSSRARLVQAGFPYYHRVISWVERLDLAVLRRGTAIDREHSTGLYAYRDLYHGKMDDLCDEQVVRRRRGEPLLPPIAVYAETRTILLDAAARMETALSRYAEVRPWLFAFFSAWIAYSLLGLASAIYLVRLNRRVQASIRASTKPSASPPASGS